MPVLISKRCIRVRCPPELNDSPGYRLLSAIMSFFTRPFGEQTRSQYRLLYQAMYYAFDFETKHISASTLRKFYNKNGHPISLDEGVLKMKPHQESAIDYLTIYCVGPGEARKGISFENRHGRRIYKYAQKNA